jgi:transposase
VDTTSFAVSGEYATAEEGDVDAQAIAITYGYSRDHRQDLKQWMLALATSGEGAVPVFLRPLDGNASDQRELVQTIESLVAHLREAGDEPGIYVADGGVYSEANMQRFAAAGVRWVSRVPETAREAKALVREEPEQWETSADRKMRWFTRQLQLPQGEERWIVVVTDAGLARARATVRQRAQRDLEQWERQLWHLGNQEFACQADAHADRERQLKALPDWLRVTSTLTRRPHYTGKGRPPGDAPPTRETWQIKAGVTVDEEQLEREAQRRARFLVATNVLDLLDLPAEQAIGVYKAQSGVEMDCTHMTSFVGRGTLISH